LFKSSQTAD